ncbi:uncharacterized protein B0T15DRAFT_185238 [Chaetomium strumarium]|uniref:Nephrocystin 3-like N-terminal domain-containing protein n=1 Tax=Chaetomium strumarium TaxID=1170767 RepID=A0AAJ0GWX9_9PEZI|nr:hypothetical protein B0T15DRAFT_185238 [Chaetomium strumarium]
MAQQQRHILPRRVSASATALLEEATIVSMDPHLLALLERREPGTARWILEDRTVRSWIDGSNGVDNLWLYGHDGAGKTVLAATLAEEMIRRADNGDADAVCFYLCRHEGAGRSGRDIMATLVLQLAMQSDAAFQGLTTAFSISCVDEYDAQAFKTELQSKSTEELSALLEAMARHFGRLSVIVVALDSITAATQRSVLSRLGAMSQTRGVPVRVAVTGPNLDATQRELILQGRFHAVFVAGKSEDIQLYVHGELARKAAHGVFALEDPAVRSGIEKYILNKSHGAWLWAVCELEAQCNLARLGRWTPQPVGDAPPLNPPLQQWPYGPDPGSILPAVYPYRSYLESVLAEGNPRTSFILNRVLKYILAAGLWPQARLGVEEMCETLTSLLNHHPSDKWYADNNLATHRRHQAVTEQDILHVCGPLICICCKNTHDDDGGARFHFFFDIAHPSVIGFFRFYSPRLPATSTARDFLRVDSPAKVMGETVDEFAAACEMLEARGLFDAAEAMHRRLVRCAESGGSGGPTHVSTLARLNNLAGFLLDRGRLDEAETMLLRAKEGYEAMDPAPTATLDRDSMYNTYNMLGILYKRRGDAARAEEHYTAALRGREDLYGPDSLEAARTAKNLGLLYVTMGGPARASHAAVMWERYLAVVEAVLGATHRDVVTGVYDLALLYKNQRRTGEAGPLMERAVEGYERLWGREDERTLDALFQLGQLCAVHGDLRRAESLFQEVVRGRERVYGERDGRVEDVRDSLALVHRELYDLR